MRQTAEGWYRTLQVFAMSAVMRESVQSSVVYPAARGPARMRFAMSFFCTGVSLEVLP